MSHIGCFGGRGGWPGLLWSGSSSVVSTISTNSRSRIFLAILGGSLETGLYRPLSWRSPDADGGLWSVLKSSFQSAKASNDSARAVIEWDTWMCESRLWLCSLQLLWFLRGEWGNDCVTTWEGTWSCIYYSLVPPVAPHPGHAWPGLRWCKLCVLWSWCLWQT